MLPLSLSGIVSRRHRRFSTSFSVLSTRWYRSCAPSEDRDCCDERYAGRSGVFWKAAENDTLEFSGGGAAAREKPVILRYPTFGVDAAVAAKGLAITGANGGNAASPDIGMTVR
jgi:hypothetical protein